MNPKIHKIADPYNLGKIKIMVLEKLYFSKTTEIALTLPWPI